MTSHRVTSAVVAVLSAAMTATATAQTSASPSADSWAWRATIYGWLPTVRSTTNVQVPGQGTLSVDVDPDDYLSNLEFAFMGALEARKGRWSVIGDVVHFDFVDAKSTTRSISGPGGMTLPVAANTNTDLKGIVAGLAGGYSVMQTPTSNVDVIAGARYLRVNAGLDYQITSPLSPLAQGSEERSKDIWDGVIGVRGRSDIGGNWFVRYHVDVGAGNSKSTWQAFAGVGYRFDWGDVTLAYRHTAYEFKDDRPLSDLTLSGALLGVSFNF
jgi:hypothetical protein